MQKKEMKGYLTFSISMLLILSACSTKPVTKAPTPTKAPVESINPNDINIPGITDTGTPTVDPGAVTPTVDPNASVPTPDPALTVTPVATATPDPALTATPVATPTADPSASVSASPSPSPSPSSATVTCEAKISGDLNVSAGNTVQLTAKNECSDGTTTSDSFNWTSSDPNIATVDSTGKVTGVKAGTINITAASGTNAAVKSTVQFKVNTSCSLALSGDLKNVPELGLNSAKNLVANVTCNDGTNSTNISWTSSDSSVAEVNSSGLVTAKKKGNAKITATYRIDTTVNSFIEITVNDPFGNESRPDLLAGQLNKPRGIDIRNGVIYVADYDNGDGLLNLSGGRVNSISSSGAFIKRFEGSTGDALPEELNGISSDGGRVWVLNRIPYAQVANNVYSFSTDGTGRKSSKIGLSGDAGTNFRDMAIDPSSGIIYIASAGLGSVIKANYDSNGIKTDSTVQNFFTGSTKIAPAGIGLDNFGNLWVSNAATNPATIQKYGKDGAKVLEFNSKGKNGTGPTLSSIGDIAYDQNNDGIVYVLGIVNGTPMVLRYDANGNFVRSFGAGSLQDPRGIAVSSDGSLYITDYAKNALVQFSPGK